MKYTGTLTVTPLQQGATAWVDYQGEAYKTTILKTFNRVYKDAANVTQEVISYEVAAFPGRKFSSDKIFATENDLSQDYEERAEEKDI